MVSHAKLARNFPDAGSIRDPGRCTISAHLKPIGRDLLARSNRGNVRIGAYGITTGKRLKGLELDSVGCRIHFKLIRGLTDGRSDIRLKRPNQDASHWLVIRQRARRR